MSELSAAIRIIDSWAASNVGEDKTSKKSVGVHRLIEVKI
jgi:hypothetical protein